MHALSIRPRARVIGEQIAPKIGKSSAQLFGKNRVHIFIKSGGIIQHAFGVFHHVKPQFFAELLRVVMALRMLVNIPPQMHRGVASAVVFLPCGTNGVVGLRCRRSGLLRLSIAQGTQWQQLNAVAGVIIGSKAQAVSTAL